MASPARRSRTSRRASPRAATRSAPAPRAGVAETLLLDLSRAVTARAAALGRAEDLHALVEMLAAAYAPGTRLSIALRKDWLRLRGDKAGRLALGWAREQVRVALAEALQRAAAAGVARRDLEADNLAWLWLAGCEALAHEPPAAVSDRTHTLGAFLAGA